MVKGISTVCPTRTSTLTLVTGANPCSSACTTKDPGVRKGTLNLPSLSLTVVLTPCAPVTVMVAPGTARPCASTIRPETVPVVSCAATRDATDQAMIPMMMTTQTFFIPILRTTPG